MKIEHVVQVTQALSEFADDIEATNAAWVRHIEC